MSLGGLHPNHALLALTLEREDVVPDLPVPVLEDVVPGLDLPPGPTLTVRSRSLKSLPARAKS